MGRDAGLGQLVEEPLGVELAERLRCRGIVEAGDVAPGKECLERIGGFRHAGAFYVARHLAGAQLQLETLLGLHEGVHEGDVQRSLVGHGVAEDS